MDVNNYKLSVKYFDKYQCERWFDKYKKNMLNLSISELLLLHFITGISSYKVKVHN